MLLEEQVGPLWAAVEKSAGEKVLAAGREAQGAPGKKGKLGAVHVFTKAPKALNYTELYYTQGIHYTLLWVIQKSDSGSRQCTFSSLIIEMCNFTLHRAPRSSSCRHFGWTQTNLPTLPQPQANQWRTLGRGSCLPMRWRTQ